MTFRCIKRAVFPLILLAGFSSCLDSPTREADPGQKKHFADISDNEDAGLRAVLDMYAGRCKYSSGVYESDEKGSKKYFRMQLLDSRSLKQHKDLGELCAANIAYLFYSKLNGDRKKYGEIRAEIVYDDDELQESYPDSVLDIVVAKMNILQGIVGLLKSRNYEALADTLNDSNRVEGFNKQDFIAKIKSIDENLGEVQKFVPYGFSFYDSVGGKPLLHLSGLIRRDKKSNEFSVNLDPSAADNRAIMIEYKL